MIRRFLSRAGAAIRSFRQNFLVREVIARGDHVYMVRWHLCRWSGGKLCLHHFLRGDEELELHDHPADFWTMILWGGYYEMTPHQPIDSNLWQPDDPCYILWHGPLSVLRHKAEDAHRVLLHEAGGIKRQCWTLVRFYERRRNWGFYTRNGWVNWLSFLMGRKDMLDVHDVAYLRTKLTTVPEVREVWRKEAQRLETTNPLRSAEMFRELKDTEQAFSVHRSVAINHAVEGTPPTRPGQIRDLT